ncbi:hypothetical protein BU198_04775 [Streptomyces sp. CBMA156]|nr:hypothetical protein [Streptomyces sp. CBMA156]
MGGSMSAERRGNRLLVENYGPSRTEYLVDEHVIVEAQPKGVTVVRYVVDQGGQWWAAGWCRTGASWKQAVAWPHDLAARLVSRGHCLRSRNPDGTAKEADQ